MKNILDQQPIFYKIVNNAITKDKMAHSFLLIGDQTNKSVNYLALRLLCEHSEPCLECDICNKYLNNTHSDVIKLDGKIESIKKKDIDLIIHNFNKSSIEGRFKIYIINNIEKSSPSALNSLLKFLEEPEKDTIAIFTTNNKQSILPTIVSRCQTIELKPIDKKTKTDKLVDKGYELATANIISELNLSLDTIELELIDFLYLQALNTIEDIYTSSENLLINTHLNLFKVKRDRNDIKIFLSIIVLLLKDLIYFKHNTPLYFRDKVLFYEKLDYDLDLVLRHIETISTYQKKLEGNADLQLLMDSLMSSL